MSTGSELREPGTPLGRDTIYDANSYMLAAAVRAAGAIAYRVGDRLRRPAGVRRRAAATSWCAPTSWSPAAASARATTTWSRRCSVELGTVEFVEVAMQPGKPQGFGIVGEDATPIFTLPGNPVSAYVSFEMFVAAGACAG